MYIDERKKGLRTFSRKKKAHSGCVSIWGPQVWNPWALRSFPSIYYVCTWAQLHHRSEVCREIYLIKLLNWYELEETAIQGFHTFGQRNETLQYSFIRIHDSWFSIYDSVFALRYLSNFIDNGGAIDEELFLSIEKEFFLYCRVDCEWEKIVIIRTDRIASVLLRRSIKL